jgi:hypothetical protein
MFNYGAKAIQKVEKAGSSQSLCEALQQWDDLLDSPFCNRVSLMERLQKTLRERTSYCRCNVPPVNIMGERMPAIYIFEENAACLVYASFKINLCSGTKQVREQISDILDLYENKLAGPRTDILSRQEIVHLLEIVQEKYQLLQVITHGRELDIYSLNKSHRLYNSWLLTYKDTAAGKLLNRWMVFSLSPNFNLLVCNKYFVFLHEIGHIFYHFIKEGGDKVPRFFHELSMVLGFPVLEDEDRLSEYFADLFAAACMNDTVYEPYNPYGGFLSGSMRELLDLYFKLLASQAKSDSFTFEQGNSGLH